MRTRVIPVLALALGIGSEVAAHAQERVPFHGALVTRERAAQLSVNLPLARGVPGFGTSSESNLTLGPCDSGPRLFNVYPYDAQDCAVLIPLGSATTLAAAGWPIHLPTGALINGITVNYFDNFVDGEPALGLWKMEGFTYNLLTAFPLDTVSSGNTTKSFAIEPPLQVDNALGYNLLMVLARLDADHYQGVYGITVRYALQVSPAPGTATFGDVPTDHPFFQFIEALAASGITGGCGGGDYCPNNPVTRGQMAVFLAKALGLHFPN